MFKKNWSFSAPNCLKRMINTKKHTYVAFFPWCKNDSSIYFFSVSKAFLKEYPVILFLIPEVWTKKWYCLHCTSPILQNYDLFIPFLFGPDPDPQIYPDPKPWILLYPLLFRWWAWLLLTMSILGPSHLNKGCICRSFRSCLEHTAWIQLQSQIIPFFKLSPL